MKKILTKGEKMFGYVTPCKGELKIKDYEKVKSYYCGLCRAMKYNYGNISRLALNYDMTFLAIFLDALSTEKNKYIKDTCIRHPFKERVFVINNYAIEYAAFWNATLAYYKCLDDIEDDNSIKGRIFSKIIKPSLKKVPPRFKEMETYLKEKLTILYSYEKNKDFSNLDELTHPFGELTAFIMLSYFPKHKNSEELYHIGYNLGKWIYIMDAYDDLKEDIEKNDFNGINYLMNKKNLPYIELLNTIKPRIDFILTCYARECTNALKQIPLEKNREIVENIFSYGMLEKMDIVLNKEEARK